MPKREYEWTDIDHPPVIARHSLNKHEVLQNYLERYLDKLYAKAHDYARFSIVDGFAGGGIYKRADTGDIHYGSPVIVMQTVASMAKTLEEKYGKKVEFRPRYYFVEKKRKFLETLSTVLERQNLQPKVDGKGGLIRESFEKSVCKIIEEIKSEGRTHKALFILDQYGYADVPKATLNHIFTSLPHAEVFLTFAVDWLIDYLSAKPERIDECRVRLEKLGIEIGVEEIIETREASPYGRLLIQELLSEELSRACGAEYFTRYFIQTENPKGKQSHRTFWLVHMSRHHIARDEMLKVHWESANHLSVHSGAAGIDDQGMGVLGYSTHHDDRLGQYNLEYQFDQEAEQHSINELLKVIPHLIWDRKAISFSDLIGVIGNYTPISSEILKRVIDVLLANKDIVVQSPNGVIRRKGSAIHWDDVIESKTLSLFA